LPMSELARETGVDGRLESYRPFFDEAWEKQTKHAVQFTKLQDAAFDLSRNWKAASHVRSLPWKMIYGLEEKRHRQIEDERFELRKIQNLRDRLVQRLKFAGVTVRPVLEKQLQNAIDDLDREWVTEIRKLKDELHEQPDDTWPKLLETTDLHGSLWGAERMCYASIYYSYEWFLKECVRLKNGLDRLRVDRGFQKLMRKTFGDDLTDSCFADHEVNIARLTRHAIAHNAARMTDDLRDKPHEFLVIDGEIQIAAPDTTQLYELLKIKVSHLLANIAAFPEFAHEEV
jgi:hypothetical protein